MGIVNKNKVSTVNFMKNAGDCLISDSILSGYSRLKHLYRVQPETPTDSGWRALSEEDTEIDSDNFTTCDYNTLATIEPAVLFVHNRPYGTDLEFCYRDGRRYFIDRATGEEI